MGNGPRFVEITRPDGRRVRVLESALGQVDTLAEGEDPRDAGPNRRTITQFRPSTGQVLAPHTFDPNAESDLERGRRERFQDGVNRNLRILNMQTALEPTQIETQLGGPAASAPIAGPVSSASQGMTPEERQAVENYATQNTPPPQRVGNNTFYPAEAYPVRNPDGSITMVQPPEGSGSITALGAPSRGPEQQITQLEDQRQAGFPEPEPESAAAYLQQALAPLESEQPRLGGPQASAPIAQGPAGGVPLPVMEDPNPEVMQQAVTPQPEPQVAEGLDIGGLDVDEFNAGTSVASSSTRARNPILRPDGTYEGIISSSDGELDFTGMSPSQALELIRSRNLSIGEKRQIMAQLPSQIPGRAATTQQQDTSTLSLGLEQQLPGDPRLAQEASDAADQAAMARGVRDKQERQQLLTQSQNQAFAEEQLRQQHEQMLRQERLRRQELRMRMDAFDRTVRGLENRSIDSQRLLNGNGGLNRIVAAISVGLGGQDAMQLVGQAIDRDIAEQRQNLQNQTNVAQMRMSAVRQMQSLFRDERAQDEAARALYFQYARQHMQRRVAEGQEQLVPALQQLREAELQATQAAAAYEANAEQQPTVSVEMERTVTSGREGRALSPLVDQARRLQGDLNRAPTIQAIEDEDRAVAQAQEERRRRREERRARMTPEQRAAEDRRIAEARARRRRGVATPEDLQALTEIEGTRNPSDDEARGDRLGRLGQTPPLNFSIRRGGLLQTRTRGNVEQINKVYDTAGAVHTLTRLRQRARAAWQRISTLGAATGLNMVDSEEGRAALNAYRSAVAEIQNQVRIIRNFGVLQPTELEILENQFPPAMMSNPFTDREGFIGFFNRLNTGNTGDLLGAQIDGLVDTALDDLEGYGLTHNSARGRDRENRAENRRRQRVREQAARGQR